MSNNNPKISYMAVVVVGLVAFCLSLAWYSPWLFGDIWAQFREGSTAAPPMWKFLVAPLREIITAAVLAFLIVRVRPPNWKHALLLGVVLWVGFYVVQLAGATIWDNKPWQLSAVHAGVWLMKVLFMTIALSAWHRRVGAFRDDTKKQKEDD
jgi:hypothetical protein